MASNKKVKDRKKKKDVLDEFKLKAGGKLEADMSPDGGKAVSDAPMSGGASDDARMIDLMEDGSIVSVPDSNVSNDTELTQEMSEGQGMTDDGRTPSIVSESDSNVSNDTELTQKKYLHPVVENDLLYFPEYEWPTPLSDMMTLGETRAQKDALLLSCITIMGGLLGRNLFSCFYYKVSFANLQTYIVASSTQDRDVLRYAQFLYGNIQNIAHDEFRKADARYKEECRKYEENHWPDNRVSMSPSSPPGPEFRFLLPGAKRGAEIMEDIIDYDGRGLIAEVEAEPVANGVAGDYWRWQDAMRKDFDNERLYVSRREGGKSREVICPAVSVLLSGSMQQLQRLIPTVDNCLFSQQLFYCMPDDKTFRNTYPSQKPGWRLGAFGLEVCEAAKNVYERVVKTDHKFHLSLTESQIDKFNSKFSRLKKVAGVRYAGKLDLVVDKLGKNVTRIIMVVAALRFFSGVHPGSYTWGSCDVWLPYCGENRADNLRISDEDFDACLGLVEPLFYHSARVAGTLSEELSRMKTKVTRDDILAMMPDRFTTKQFSSKAKEYGVESSTYRNWVRPRYKDINCLGGGVIVKVKPRGVSNK